MKGKNKGPQHMYGARATQTHIDDSDLDSHIEGVNRSIRLGEMHELPDMCASIEEHMH